MLVTGKQYSNRKRMQAAQMPIQNPKVASEEEAWNKKFCFVKVWELLQDALLKMSSISTSPRDGTEAAYALVKWTITLSRKEDA